MLSLQMIFELPFFEEKALIAAANVMVGAQMVQDLFQRFWVIKFDRKLSVA